MDNFMNRLMTINFDGCFLTNIKNIDLDYSKVDNTEINCTFTMSYYQYKIFVNNKDLRKFIPDQGIGLDDHDKKLIKMDQ
jgi:hypothetical protein